MKFQMASRRQLPESSGRAPSIDQGQLAGATTGSVIGTLFGVGWWLLGAGSVTGTAGVVVLWCGVAVGVILLGVCVALRRQAPRLPAAAGRSPFGWRYGVVVAAMAAAIVAGSLGLRTWLDRPEAVPDWVLFVVGVHFAAFVSILRTRLFGWLAAALCVVAVVGAFLGAAGIAEGWNAVPGFGGAAALWVAAATSLLDVRRGLTHR